MKIKETPFQIELQGCLVVNYACILKSSKDVVAIEIDMKSKRGDVIGSGSTDGIPLICIDKNEDTCDHDLTKKGQTIISLPEFKGWDVWAVTLTRYTLAICLIKNRTR